MQEFQTQDFKDGDLHITKIGPLGPVSNNVYIVADARTKQAMIVDSPQGVEAIFPALDGLDVERVVVTHRHNDHWAGIETLRAQVTAPVYCHADDQEPWAQHVAGALADGDEFSVGGLKVRVLHTPGHSPGSICLLVGGHLLSGDTLFPGGPGRTREPALLKQIIESITSKLYVLPESTAVHPGHGTDTTIGESKQEYAGFASRAHDPDLAGDVLWASS